MIIINGSFGTSFITISSTYFLSEEDSAEEILEKFNNMIKQAKYDPTLNLKCLFGDNTVNSFIGHIEEDSLSVEYLKDDNLILLSAQFNSDAIFPEIEVDKDKLKLKGFNLLDAFDIYSNLEMES